MRLTALPGKKLFFLVFLLLSTCLSLITVKSAHAYSNDPTPHSLQTTNENNSLNTTTDVEKNLHNGTQLVMLNVLSALTCQVTGYDPMTSDHKCLGVDPTTGKIGFVDNGGGMITVMSTLIGATFTPPASTLQYKAYLKNNFGVTKKAYAQEPSTTCNGTAAARGIGFCGLEPLLPLWIAMRNVVYLIMILIFVVIGLGIMLRVHIDPRTVMTVQNQIPKIIIGIILVTFSYAIAGFLIDVMWVCTYLFASVISHAGGLDNVTINAVASAPNPFVAATSIFNSGDGGDKGGIFDVAGKVATAFTEIIKGIFLGSASNFSGDMVMGFIGNVVGTIVNLLAFLIIAVAIVIALFRLWITLLLAYINIILDVVFAPFWIITGVLPGSTLGIGGWLKDLLANLAIFPVSISMMLLAKIFVDAFQTDGGTRFIPPLVSGTSPGAISAIIGLGFLLMLPNVLKSTKGFFKSPDIKLGPVMSPIAAAGGIVGGAPKRFGSGAANYVFRTKYDEHNRLKEEGKFGAMAKGLIGRR